MVIIFQRLLPDCIAYIKSPVLVVTLALILLLMVVYCSSNAYLNLN